MSQVFIFAVLIIHIYVFFKFRQTRTKLLAVVISGVGACREVSNIVEDSYCLCYVFL